MGVPLVGLWVAVTSLTLSTSHCPDAEEPRVATPTWGIEASTKSMLWVALFAHCAIEDELTTLGATP